MANKERKDESVRYKVEPLNKCKEYTVKKAVGVFKVGQKVKLSENTAKVFKTRGIV